VPGLEAGHVLHECVVGSFQTVSHQCRQQPDRLLLWPVIIYGFAFLYFVPMRCFGFVHQALLKTNVKRLFVGIGPSSGRHVGELWYVIVLNSIFMIHGGKAMGLPMIMICKLVLHELDMNSSSKCSHLLPVKVLKAASHYCIMPTKM
jgi:hypothetical protein